MQQRIHSLRMEASMLEARVTLAIGGRIDRPVNVTEGEVVAELEALEESFLHVAADAPESEVKWLCRVVATIQRCRSALNL